MRNGFLSGLLLMAAVFVPPVGWSAEKVVADGVIAQVNNNFITIGDVMILLQPVQRQLATRYSGVELKAQMRVVFTNALNSMIERRLILDAYEKQENKFPDTYIDGRVEEISQDMFSGDRSDLMAALAKEKLHYEEWLKEMKDHVIVSTMRRMNVEQNVTISAKAIRKAYDSNVERYKTPAKVKLRMIVISKNASGKQKADETRKKIVEGADFAEIAKSVSEGSKAADGGDWGWIEPKILRPELGELVSKLKPGEISQVKEIDDQFYILKVEDKKEDTVASFAEVQPQIERELRKSESEKVYNGWIERLRKDAYVKVFDTGLF
ncbi:MAG: peptidyl-prolyl cis-trans isomerase [Kiritimatiellae bacterium]|nr:peptidyl-prolyl cis-trans isomerase [Kiritimatiellia bacterium]MDD5521676.1 peptidyl-prolyl cis-trans isomerase [Kiritimatiellia bacterium]